MMLVMLCLAAATLIGVAHWAFAAGEQLSAAAAPATPVATPLAGGLGDNPIVSVVPSVTETEYEQDPFDQTRLRRSTNRVRTMLLIHANGEVETKQIQ
jgi:hypothetical protein